MIDLVFLQALAKWLLVPVWAALVLAIIWFVARGGKPGTAKKTEDETWWDGQI